MFFYPGYRKPFLPGFSTMYIRYHTSWFILHCHHIPMVLNIPGCSVLVLFPVCFFCTGTFSNLLGRCCTSSILHWPEIYCIIPVCPLIRISSQGQEICPNVPLTGNVFNMIEFSCTAMAQRNKVVTRLQFSFVLLQQYSCYSNLDASVRKMNNFIR